MADILEKSSVPLEAAAAVSNGTAATEVATAVAGTTTTRIESTTGIPAQPIAATTVNDSHLPLLLKEQQHQQEQIYQQQKEKQQQQSATVTVAAAAAVAAAAPSSVAALDVKQAQPEQKD
ncbi:uncharacterized protein [Bactrocera oleae]|uniref:uncharacterized protein n=1 Tax=Bactrocera oleae TaxID=104688 RepID=UPI00387EAC8A